jgi:RNA-directed DNA polymerase
MGQLLWKDEPVTSVKPFVIPKRLVWDAYQRVKANRGAAGVDGQSISDFERDLSRNLYQIWNRMSSGSYFPPAVKAVPIPKKSGGERILGVPTVGDRISQTIVTMTLEPILEPVFHDDSYVYRRGKSAHDALAVTRKRCWERDWVLEYDIRGLFDHIDHNLLFKALRHHCQDRSVGVTQCRALAHSTNAKSRWNARVKERGHATRRSTVSGSCEPILALCLGSVANGSPQGHSVLSVC